MSMRLRRQCQAHYAGLSGAVVRWGTFSSQASAKWAVFVAALDEWPLIGIMQVTDQRRCSLAETPPDDKAATLRRAHAFNPRARAVTAAAFTSGHAFFDARDLVQVKYEMLRRVREDGQTVSRAAADFGFSRPAFYQTQAIFDAAGLPGLLPQRPGPKRAHKLSEEVVDRVERALAADPSLNAAQLTERLEQELGLRVHRRSVERALSRRKKGVHRRS